MKPKLLVTLAAATILALPSVLAIPKLPEFQTKAQLQAMRAEQAAARASAALAEVHAASNAPTFYTGKISEPQVGHYLFLFRNYDAGSSRWSSLDPSGYPDGANNSAYRSIPTSQFDWQGLVSVSFRVVTAIRPPDAQDGIKSSHQVVVDTATGSITSDVQFFGTTSIGGVQLPGSGTLTAILNSVSDCHIDLTLNGTAASATLPIEMSIDYSFRVYLDLHVGRNGLASLSGQHDGYPSYEYYINGTKRYDFNQTVLSALFPPVDIPVARNFTTGIENALCE